MKKKLIMFITGMLVTASVLMGCSSNASVHTDDSEEQEDREEKNDSSRSDSEENVSDENVSEENTDDSISEENTGVNNDLFESDPYGKVKKGNYPRLVEYLECKTYDQFSAMINEDSADGYPVLIYQDINGSYELNAYIYYEEYERLIIDGVVYDKINVTYNSSTNELMQFGVLSGDTSVEQCKAFEKFAIDYFGDDYTIPESHLAGELGEAWEAFFLYRYEWLRDGDITITACADNIEDTHKFSVGWFGPEY